jgi:NFACT protein RNA binding domain
MGKDKYENEDLIKYSLPLDIWFHVDSLSSAHVYLRLPNGVTMDRIAPEALEDAAQLVKANSIQGCKVNNLSIVYTPASNLKKTPGMDVGQVGYHNEKNIKKMIVDKKNNDIVNRLNRSKKELYPDLEAERAAYDKELRGQAKAVAVAQKQEEKAAKEEQKRSDELKSYKNIMKEEDMVTVREMREKYATVEDYEDDFM